MYYSPFTVTTATEEKVFKHISDAVLEWSMLLDAKVIDANGVEIPEEDLWPILG